MKKNVLILLGLVMVVGGWYFYYQNLRGIAPAILPPTEDIVKLANTTGLPLKIPDNFNISIFAEGLGKPRVIINDPSGNLLVSLTSQGKVIALPDKNNDGKADNIITITEGLTKPHGLAVYCEGENCKLYIAESDQVAVYDYDKENLKAINKKKIIDLPDSGRHFTKTLLFRSESDGNELLISTGSSCDTCDEEDWRRAKILVADKNGGNLRTFASGLRNSVFMAIHPITGKVWATEMGRDLLGDDLPPDEINIIKEGGNYGWPICYGKNIHDTVFDKKNYIRNPCLEPFEKESHIDIPAHSSPLGLAFVPKEGWTEEYWYDLFVAYHGSWNRSEPTGYKIVRYKLDENGNYLGVEDFISGWLRDDGGALGRPAGILVQPGGIMYITDDKAGVVYKVNYKK